MMMTKKKKGEGKRRKGDVKFSNLRDTSSTVLSKTIKVLIFFFVSPVRDRNKETTLLYVSFK